MLTSKPKFNFNFIIKINTLNEEAKITKLNPVLTQLSIEKSSKLDEFLAELFSDYLRLSNDFSFLSEKKDLKDFTLFMKLNLILWKNTNFFPKITLKPFILENLFKSQYALFKNVKHLFYETTTDLYQPSEPENKYKQFLFKLLYLSSIEVNPDLGYSFNKSELLGRASTILSHFRTYKNRSKDLGRKVNFKRKIEKKKFSEY